MILIFPALLFILLLAVVAGVRAAKAKNTALTASGLYPKEGLETDADVLRLVKAGEKIHAIKCYRAVHKVGLKEAKDAVDLLAKNQA